MTKHFPVQQRTPEGKTTESPKEGTHEKLNKEPSKKQIKGETKGEESEQGDANKKGKREKQFDDYS